MQHEYSAATVARFWSSVDTSGECWEWQGAVNVRHGYGEFRFGDHGRARAHRFAYVVDIGPIPDGLLVCHRCDNRRCVRPSHLFLGTHTENLKDAIDKGRHHAPLGPKGSRHGMAKLTEADVMEIRRLAVETHLLQREIGARFGVGQNLVSRILTRKIWAHL